MTNPADGSPLPPLAWTPVAAVAAAISTARAAQPAWAAWARREREDALRRVARQILERRGEIAALIAQETGRTATDAIASEIVFVAENVEAAIRVCTRATAPERIKVSRLDFPGKRVSVEAVPRGVIGVIAPWNYPLANFYKSLWPALLSGNAVVMKPSEFTPRTGAWLAEVLREHVPADCVQVVQGAGDVGAALLPGVDGLVFTGSLATGRRVAGRAAELLERRSVELGGKDAAIVLADCNFERTVAAIVHWSLHNAGQDCASVERVYVEDAIADRFVAAVATATAKVRVAPQPDGHAEIGPLQTEAQLHLVTAHVADAVARGARLLVGGKAPGAGLGFEPTVLDGCTPEMQVMREETFGPIVAIQRVKDAEEALRLANDSGYGLTGSVWTKDAAKGEALARRLEVGVAMVNNHAFTGTMPETPWSGIRGSGSGVAMSGHAYGTFVRRRTLMIDTNTGPDAWWFPANADLDVFMDAAARKGLGSIAALWTLLPLLGKRAKAIRAFAAGS
jgi:acyl-CoA reductase-like NAD-dependent aldehyde dehydrogenase